MGGAEIAIVIAVYLVMLVVGLLFFSNAAKQAKRRGYSFLVWLVAGILVLNPIYLLIVLATVPHRGRQKLREQFRRELDAKLAAGGAPAALPVARAVTDRSLGDLATRLPGASAATDEPPVRERSLGDVPTVLPDVRSVGDEPSRM
jgi:hypothetical protein